MNIETSPSAAVISQYSPSRPMWPLLMDGAGALWFYTDLRSEKVEHLRVLNLAFVPQAMGPRAYYWHLLRTYWSTSASAPQRSAVINPSRGCSQHTRTSTRSIRPVWHVTIG